MSHGPAMEIIHELASLKENAWWSFEQWDDLIARAHRNGFMGSPFAGAIERREKWLEKSRKDGLSPQEAEQVFVAECDEQLREDQDRQQRARELRAVPEQAPAGPKRKPPAERAEI